MVLLGVILVLLAAAAGVVLIVGTAQLEDTVQIDVLGGTLSIPPLTLLVTGMIVISVFWLGWALLRSSLRRSKRRRIEAKEAAAAAEASRAEEQKRLQDEFAAREQALTEERRRREAAEARVADTTHDDHGRRTAAGRLGRHHHGTTASADSVAAPARRRTRRRPVPDERRPLRGRLLRRMPRASVPTPGPPRRATDLTGSRSRAAGPARTVTVHAELAAPAPRGRP